MDTFFYQNNIIPNLIKVDVEGYEALIFESMSAFLRINENCKILFEFADWAEKLADFEIGSAQNIMLMNNYKLFDIEKNKTINSPIKIGSTNIIAVKKQIELLS